MDEEINLDELRHEVWPMSTGWETRLADYALGTLDLKVTELGRKARLAHEQSKLLLDIALHPENYTFTD
jgi:hypothetical protein